MKKLIFIVLVHIIAINLYSQVQPSIMVVPYKTNDEKYLEIIESNRYKRIAIAKLDEFFLNRNFRTINFLAQLQNRSYDSQLETNHLKTVEQIIAEKNKADIICYIDASYVNYLAHGETTFQVNMTITAIDVQSAQVLASIEGESKAGSFNDEEFYLKDAISRVADNFLNVLNEQLKRTREEGVPMRLSISLSEQSGLNFYDEVGNDYNTLMDELEYFLRNNAFNNYLRCPIKVESKYECEDFRLPLMNPDNPLMTYTPSDLYRKMNRFLREGYQLYSKPSFIGNGLRVTICGKQKCGTSDLPTHCAQKISLAKSAAEADQFEKSFKILDRLITDSDSRCSEEAFGAVKEIFQEHQNYLCKGLFVDIQTAINLGNTQKASRLIGGARMISPCYNSYEEKINSLVDELLSSQEYEELQSQIRQMQREPIKTGALAVVKNFLGF